MHDIAARPGVEKPRVRPMHTPTQAEKLNDLAHRVARLGRGCRDPEAFVVAKLTLAAELRRLAREARP